MPRPVVASCRPVEFSAEELEVARQAGIELPPVYPGSVVTDCAHCARGIYLGPRVQEAMQANPNITALCPSCSADLTGGAPPDVVNLGNPFQRKP